jgi:hypothetical protein
MILFSSINFISVVCISNLLGPLNVTGLSNRKGKQAVTLKCLIQLNHSERQFIYSIQRGIRSKTRARRAHTPRDIWCSVSVQPWRDPLDQACAG